MDGLARVFLEVRPGNADTLLIAVRIADEQFAVLDDRQLILADLVALGQVRIEVVLAGEYRTRRDRRVNGESELRGHAHNFGVQNRQDAGIAEVDQAGLGIWICAISR